MRNILRNFTKKNWLFVFITVILTAFSVFLELKLPDYMSDITILIETEGSQMSEILLAGTKMLLCALFSLIISVSVVVLSARVASDYSFNIREKLYKKVENFSMNEINKFSTASLITRSTNDITQIQNFIVFGMHALLKAPIMAVWSITKIAGKASQWVMSTAVAVGLVCIVLIFCYVFALPKFKRIQSLTDNINRLTRENLTGLRVIRAYNAEEYQENKFEKANDEITQNNLKAHRMMSVMMPSMTLSMNGLALVVYIIGAFIIEQAQLTERIALFSDMVVFSAYAIQVIMSFMMLNMIFIMAPRAIVSAKRINEVTNTEISITDGSFDGKTEIEGEIEFKNVSFKYQDAAENILENISFSARKGETVAIIGSTGCGKSTLINLIPRFFDCTEGEVLVDGINVKNYKLSCLHNKIGYVSQKAVMFSGTVNTNVAFGENGKNDYTEGDVKRAVKIAQATDFVENMSEQYDSDISQGGTNLSGGQKQRLSVARAICRKPEILIFDDSFSALDYKTDHALRTALKKDTAGVTNIIVAQRIGTIKDADKIIVLDDGKVVAQGKHKELLKTCDVYHEIALSQLSEEELQND